MARADSKALFIIIGRLPSLHSLNKKVIVDKVEKLLAICDLLEIHVTSNQTHAEQLMQAVLQEAFSQTTKPPKQPNKRGCKYDR